MNALETVESLADEAKTIQGKLEAGTMSNAVARTLLAAIKLRMDGFRMNMQASSLGCDIIDHATHARDRIKLKVVA